MLRTLTKLIDQGIRVNIFTDFESDLQNEHQIKNTELIPAPRGIKSYLLFCLYSVVYKLFGFVPKRFRKLIRAISDSNLIIDLSGFALTDDFGKNSGTYRGIIFLLQAFCAKVIFRKKYFIFPQSFGPFRRKLNKMIARIIILMADLVFVRGRRSYKYIGCETRDNIRTIDLVFHKSFIDSYKSQLNCQKHNKKYVLLNPNSRIYHKEKKQNKTDYISFLEEIIRYYLDRNMLVVLTPNEIRDFEEDDVYLCNRLADKFKGRKVRVNTNLEISHLLKLIQNAHYVIVSRFHLMIFSLITNTPLIVLSWSDKYLDIMETFGMEKYCLKNFSKFFDVVSGLEESLSEIKRSIRVNLACIQEKIHKDILENPTLRNSRMFINV
ncbi:polysaccharide pyruvyl transferase family protein [Planctomycetota bacterium]